MREELKELYAEMNFRQSFLQGDEDEKGTCALSSDFNEIYRLISLECLLKRIAIGAALTFNSIDSFRKLGKRDKAQLEQDFRLVRFSDELYCDQYEYSVYITEFFRALFEIGPSNFEPTSKWTDPTSIPRAQRTSSEPSTKFQYELYDELVVVLRNRLSSAEVVSAQRVRRSLSGKNFKDAAAYLDSYFGVYPKIYALQIDIGYQIAPLWTYGASEQGANGLDRIRRDIGMLTKQIGQGRWYPELFGYLAKLEFGKSRGYFVTIVVLLSGAKAVSEEVWFERIRNLWRQVTKGEGVSHNWNKGIPRHNVLLTSADRGLGLMVKGSTMHIAFERHILGYLALTNGFLRVKVGKRERTFFKGVRARANTASQRMVMLPTGGI